MSASPNQHTENKNPHASFGQNGLRVFVYGHRHLTVVTEIYSARALCTLSITYDLSQESHRQYETDE